MAEKGYKVLLELGGEIQGDKLCELLRAIERFGSINRAAGELKISYRHGWGLLKAAEAALAAPLLQKRTGGAQGGGSELTDAARALLSSYDRFRSRVAADAEIAFQGEDEPAGVPLLLASTIGPVEAGVVGALEEAFYQETGLLVRHVAAGSGQALAIARSGRAELVLAHAPALEAEFLAAGYGTGRYPLMSNEFLLLGPAADPAGAGACANAAEGFQRCAVTKSPFVSRGDRSGTHVKELEVWAEAGIQPAGQPWYTVCARGSMGSMATLRFAEERQAYFLADRATYLAARAGGLTLTPLVAGVRNEFALIPVSPQRFPGLQHEAALRFAAWATGPAGQAVIRQFGRDRYGEPLFAPAS